MKHILCPYCGNEISFDSMRFRCPNCGANVISSTSDKIWKTLPHCRNEKCQNITADMYCPHCETMLPKDSFIYSKILSFSLIGYKSCGKTEYITTALNEMMNHISKKLVIEPIDDNTSNWFNNNLNDINEGIPVCSTPNRFNNVYLWNIKNNGARMFNGLSEMIIYEHYGSMIRELGNFIVPSMHVSDQFILVIDALSFKSVRDDNPDEVLEFCPENLMEYIYDMVNKIHEEKNIPLNQRIHCNLAVVLSKVDLIHSDHTLETVMKESPYSDDCVFVKSDADKVDKEIRSWLIDNGGESLVESIETSFEDNYVRFFGVSCLTVDPLNNDNSRNHYKSHPHRVLDPIYWMLANKKIIPTMK